MKKFFIAIFLCIAGCAYTLNQESSHKELKGEELCQFTEEVFSILHQHKKSQTIDFTKLKTYQASSSHMIQEFANALFGSFNDETISDEELGEIVTSLGRLVKCSVDDKHHTISTSFTINKAELSQTVHEMDSVLGKETPNNQTNFHKLMIESLADKQYDLALYSYMKIAEGRCTNS